MYCKIASWYEGFSGFDRHKFCVLVVHGLESVLSLSLIEDFESFLSSLDARESHGSKGRAHSVCTINFTQLHASNNETWNNLSGSFDNCVLSSVHVETSHTAKLLNLLHRDKTFHAESTKRSVVARSGYNDGRVDGIWIHAALVVMVHGNESPIGDDTSNSNCAISIGTSYEVLNSRGIEEFDIREG